MQDVIMGAVHGSKTSRADPRTTESCARIQRKRKHAKRLRRKTDTTRWSQPIPSSIAGTRLHKLSEERHHWTTFGQAKTSKLPSSVARGYSNAELAQAQT